MSGSRRTKASAPRAPPLSLFEEFQPPDAAARLRAVAFVPLAAFIAEQLYFTIAQLLSHVPALLFYGIDAVLLFGAMFGAIGTVRVVRKERLGGRAWFWLVAAVALSLLCALMFARLTFPWL